ncbi:MAG: carbohydrate kinase [Bacteroidetes bacterium]|nr:carbohydrate kinase [Bacteroidota bacterium]
MVAQQVTVVFDVGKSNKKLLLFDENFHVLEIKEERLPEIKDDEGFPCEDLILLTSWIKDHFEKLCQRKDVQVKAINFSGYGASLVHLDKSGKPVGQLENYLKPFPDDLAEKFIGQYGPVNRLTVASASPWLGNLNSGLLLYRIKHQRPELFQNIVTSLHLPQYLSWILTGEVWNDLTGMGCHTMMWDFGRGALLDWVRQENLDRLLPPFFQQNHFYSFRGAGGGVKIGTGIHDSSAALIPYVSTLQDPFVLISTGTWSISLNPFNHAPLLPVELEQDCLCYLAPDGRQVKASRLLLGPEFEKAIGGLALKYHCTVDSLLKISFVPEWRRILNPGTREFDLHQLTFDLAARQKKSTLLILGEGNVRRIYVDGGFSKNEMFMQMLSSLFDGYEVYAAELPQASAVGAAIQIRRSSEKSLPMLSEFTFRKYANF